MSNAWRKTKKNHNFRYIPIGNYCYDCYVDSFLVAKLYCKSDDGVEINNFFGEFFTVFLAKHYNL